MKRVTGIYLIDSLSSGGAQRQIVELVKNIDKSRIRPIVVTYHDLPFFQDELARYGIKTLLLEKRDKIGFTFMVRFMAFLRKIRPDFIHSFLNVPNFYARMMKFTGTVEKVITSERNISIMNSFALSMLEKLTWRLSGCIIVNAHGIKKILVEQIGIPEKKIVVIYNGVAANRFNKFSSSKVKEIRDKINIGSDDKCQVLGLIGRLVDQKNHIGILDALNLIRRYKPDLKIKIGFWGSEPLPDYSEKVRKKIVNLGLQDAVLFGGTEKDINSVYAVCDVIVLPSLWEGFPNVLIEAMAAGKLVIASDIVDNARIIKDGVNGFLFPSGSSKALANKIIEVIEMPKDSKLAVSKQARQDIIQNYSTENMVLNTMKIYKEMELC